MQKPGTRTGFYFPVAFKPGMLAREKLVAKQGRSTHVITNEGLCRLSVALYNHSDFGMNQALLS